MKFILRFSISSLGLVAVLFCFWTTAEAQRPTEPVLVDEFGSGIPCGDLSARLDTFIGELGGRPDWVGHVILGVDSERPGQAFYRERFIDGYARHRGIDERRLDVVRGTEASTKFWLVPQGGNLVTPIPSYEFPGSGRKAILYSDLRGIEPCYTGPPFRLLSRYMQFNPDTTSNIAIGSLTTKEFLKAKNEIVNLFDSTYRVSSSRLRFFRVPGHFYSTGYELWLIKRKPRSPKVPSEDSAHDN